MNNELQILDNLNKNANAKQRDISKKTGISLGNVNILIKRLIKKGMLKVEKINSRTIKYVLTPIGLKERVEATYNYIVSSFKYIDSVETNIDVFIDTFIKLNRKELVLYGEEDKIYIILKLKLNQKNINYELIKSLEIIIDYAKKSDILILVWQPRKYEELSENNIKFSNLLDIV